MKLIFVNRFFYPDLSATSQLLTELTIALRSTHQNLIIITSRQSYENPKAKLQHHEVYQNIKIVRVWSSTFGRQNLLGRTVDYITFYASSAIALIRLTRSGDIVIVKTDPPMLSVLAAPITKLKRAHLVNWLQDLFPEVAEALGVVKSSIGQRLFQCAMQLRNWSLQQASMNIALGQCMSDRLFDVGIEPNKVQTIHNWADRELIHPIEKDKNHLRTSWNLQDSFVVGYSGNFGRAHESQTLFEAIQYINKFCNDHKASTRDRSFDTDELSHLQVRARSQIDWVFIGGGIEYQTLQKKVALRGFENVVFRPYQEQANLAESISLPDLHLVSLRPELEGLIVPSKFYGIAAAGRPTIFIGDQSGEIAQLLAQHNCGYAISQGDGRALADIILSLSQDPEKLSTLGKNARQAFLAHFDKTHAVRKWKKIFKDLAVTCPHRLVQVEC